MIKNPSFTSRCGEVLADTIDELIKLIDAYGGNRNEELCKWVYYANEIINEGDFSEFVCDEKE